MNKHHQQLLAEIKKAAGEVNKEPPKGYLGSSHKKYGLSNPQKRKIVKEWKKKNKGISVNEFISLLDSLYKGESYDEKTLAGMLLGYMTKLREKISPEKLDNWLEELEGWAEIDSLCQSNFTAQEILNNWDNWKKWLEKFQEGENVSKRRAALVLLTKPVRDSDNQKIADLAFANIDYLKSEDDKLITKAVSWLLRALIKHHPNRVEEYLENNQDSLPAIAVRETRNKLETGKK